MKYFLTILISAVIFGCTQLTLEPSDFAWPIESVLSINENGLVQEERYSFSTNVKSLFFVEKNDSNAYLNETVRIIRGTEGYYYITANEFKNVYLFKADNGNFIEYDRIFISEFGLDLPAFNQRKPFIELLDGEQHVAYLNSDGIKGEE